MKFSLPILASLICFSSLVFAQDGASGDGTCDPCDESCEYYSKRDIAEMPRMVEYNDTSPWEAGETMRWRKPVSAAGSRLAKRTFTLEFNCGVVPEICYNMCFGWNCKGHPKDLTINRGGCKAARKANACGVMNPNYCSAQPKIGFSPGYSCDEYPFASTSEGSAAGANAATRCVPATQNSSQGGKISGLYKNGQNGSGRLADGTVFTVSVGSFTGGYCSTSSPDCSNKMIGDAASSGTQQ